MSPGTFGLLLAAVLAAAFVLGGWYEMRRADQKAKEAARQRRIMEMYRDPEKQQARESHHSARA